ncbi:DUF1361 domain-containing protein [Flavobacterium sp. MAH-1]|uniref:DUF1361 domain-containing protein n=1 Tax=Flavobacterium agri TaxID=2743471 RepID=A0A7Y8XZH2_9FLAO|nr:DUF1361 domain-containing protein [Flavobacterium agri]NUY79567.1 DUF1361 domain-containing protein [Flavobacterium agri]NYA69592.1 DUF1361 domain-containing protein [Flavobacterium agri]
MIKTISNSNHYRSVFALIAFNCALLAFRMFVTSGIGYGFLLWNLVLSAVPLVISDYLLQADSGKPKILALSAIWLLFLPNAPYILTDFLHFRHLTQTMPAWFDLLLLASYSISGMLFGLLSMRQMQSVWDKNFGRVSNWLVPFSAILSGFGIYLGRFERYNSWDVVSDPFRLIVDAAGLLTELRAIGFTIGYGTLLLLVYHFFNIQPKNHSNQ